MIFFTYGLLSPIAPLSVVLTLLVISLLASTALAVLYAKEGLPSFFKRLDVLLGKAAPDPKPSKGLEPGPTAGVAVSSPDSASSDRRPSLGSEKRVESEVKRENSFH